MSPIDIVGGVYSEYILHPPHQGLFGSAGRAAAAIGPDRAAIKLHSAVERPLAPDLREFAENYGCASRSISVDATCRFSYIHGLDQPRITPNAHTIVQKPSLTVTGQNILCFGALDFDWHVDGEQVVYDPQDAFSAKTFGATGSQAQRLAIVLNEYEAATLARTPDIEKMFTHLFAADSPEVVVLKRGSKGTIVATRDGRRPRIPPQLTPTVFKLGSGDVFSGIFAWAWMLAGKDAHASALLASHATAYYVSTRSLPIPLDVEERNAELGIQTASATPVDNASVYLAGPFFTMTQIWLVEEARLYFRDAGLRVFSPLHDVGPGPANKVAKADLEALHQCDIVYAIVSGLDPGTIFEIGYARAIGKPVIVFVENEKADDLKMLEGTGCTLVHDFASSIYRAAWQAQFPG